MKQLLLLGLLLAGLGLTGCEFNQLAEDEQVDQPLLVPKLQINGQKAKTASNQQTSLYSCLISTLADDEADYNYWNQAFWVHFPKPAVEQAEGKTIFKAFSFASEHAGEKAGSWAGKDNIVRVAQCEIPDSELAETLLEEQLRKFGKDTWLESHKANQKSSSQNEVQAKSSSDWEWECSEYFITVVCQVDSQTGELTNCMITDIRCISYELVYNEPPAVVAAVVTPAMIRASATQWAPNRVMMMVEVVVFHLLNRIPVRKIIRQHTVNVKIQETPY